MILILNHNVVIRLIQQFRVMDALLMEEEQFMSVLRSTAMNELRREEITRNDFRAFIEGEQLSRKKKREDTESDACRHKDIYPNVHVPSRLVFFFLLRCRRVGTPRSGG